MPLVERKDSIGPVSLSENDDRRVGESDPVLAIASGNLSRAMDVGGLEQRQLVCPCGNVVEQGKLRVDPGVLHEEVIDLRENVW